ncbi:hypothetical protein BD324DRAFT_648046 [Kockovaella imperatae]|uniref:BZIP domain-containing protein n=1 Tax=Kockovaella imperatae TaxID=4999 RepID=A0A1Y1UUK9_9TREE|nr:hypothetical protein BD324DRAFT_648046 [Kockovaella imperatae]ORX41156.1 hypothetical protein BD324DRAFT_648046 [Kockovaella imperatae]
MPAIRGGGGRSSRASTSTTTTATATATAATTSSNKKSTAASTRHRQAEVEEDEAYDNNYHDPHSDDGGEVSIDPSLNDMNSVMAAAAVSAVGPGGGGGGGSMGAGPSLMGPGPGPPGMMSASGGIGMGMMPSGSGMLEDGDNRTRNAKAQRRHREKRKAHLKALEESVQLLTLQLEDARRQLSQSAYYTSQRGSQSGGPLSPQSNKDFATLQAENAYLRDENSDLRRQLYSLRMPSYPSTSEGGPKDGANNGNGVGGGPSGAGMGGGPGGNTGSTSWDVKPDESGQFGVYQQGGGNASPRRSGEASAPSTAEGGPSSASSSNGNGNYQPMEHFTPMHQRTRSRNMSTDSPGNPNASPYLNQEGRSVDPRYSSGSGMRNYDPPTPVFNAQASHSTPRYEVHHYTPRQSEDSISWPPESGPPPFSGYPLNFENSNNEDWRHQD